jgi:hypothetical protein
MLDRSRQTQPIIIRNNAAIAVWVFMAVWMGMLCLFTYIFMRDGGIPDFGLLGPVFFGVFWLGGLGATAWALSQPRIRVTIAGQRVVTRESWLWRARTALRRGAAPRTGAPRGQGQRRRSLFQVSPEASRRRADRCRGTRAAETRSRVRALAVRPSGGMSPEQDSGRSGPQSRPFR